MRDASNKLSWVEGRGLVAEIRTWRCPKNTFVSITRCIWTTTLSKCRVTLKSMCTNVALCETHWTSCRELQVMRWLLKFTQHRSPSCSCFMFHTWFLHHIVVQRPSYTKFNLFWWSFRWDTLNKLFGATGDGMVAAIYTWKSVLRTFLSVLRFFVL